MIIVSAALEACTGKGFWWRNYLLLLTKPGCLSGKTASRLINSEVIHQKCIIALQISNTPTPLENSATLIIIILATCSKYMVSQITLMTSWIR